MELRPFFTKILAWTTFVHFSNPGAKNPSLDELLGIYALFVEFLGIYELFVEFCPDRNLRTFVKILIFFGFTHFFVDFLGIYALFEFCRDRRLRTFVKILS